MGTLFLQFVEQDHRFIKKRVRAMLGLKSFQTAKKVRSDMEAMHMVKKGQLLLRDKSVQNQVKFIYQLWDLSIIYDSIRNA